MVFAEKYDKTLTGLLSGVTLPVIVGLIIYMVSSPGLSIPAYLTKIAMNNVLTHSISLCVFPNVVIFLIFSRFDMLRACRGVLAVTIIWAIVVFLVKFFG